MPRCGGYARTTIGFKLLPISIRYHGQACDCDWTVGCRSVRKPRYERANRTRERTSSSFLVDRAGEKSVFSMNPCQERGASSRAVGMVVTTLFTCRLVNYRLSSGFRDTDRFSMLRLLEL